VLHIITSYAKFVKRVIFFIIKSVLKILHFLQKIVWKTVKMEIASYAKKVSQIYYSIVIDDREIYFIV